MEILECLKCKGQIEIEQNGLVGKCLSCETVYHFNAEKSSRIIALLNQANISRLRGDYDGAILAYKIALQEDETDADAHWGIVLSKFGIEYVEDERTKEIKPTCRRTIAHSILDDDDYSRALQYASLEQGNSFEEKAKEIDELQKAIKEKIKTESDYEVFLCFKSTDTDGNATADRFIARSIFEELSKRGIKTFFSEISLKDRLGKDYEPIIYKALYTAKIFILIATEEAYIQAPWVRNEWSRFRDRIADENLINAAFAVFKNIRQSQLPPIFRSQGVDLEKYPAGGFEVEIADSLELRLKQKKFSSLNENLEDIFKNGNTAILEDKVVDLLERKLVGSRQTYDEKLERAVTYYEIGQKDKALEILEQIIDEYPRKPAGWFQKAKWLTEDFNINATMFHQNSALKKEVFFCIDNSLRFSSGVEKEKFQKEAKQLLENEQTLEVVDTSLEKMEGLLAEFVKMQNEMEKYQGVKEEEDEAIRKGHIDALKITNEQIKKLKKQVSNKNYYIKSQKSQPSTFQTFAKFLSLLFLTVSTFATGINLAISAKEGTSLLPVLWEFLLLVAVGTLPYFIIGILSKYKKLIKVKSVIEKDRSELERLQQESQSLKRQLNQAQSAEADDENKTILERLSQKHEKQKELIVEEYKGLSQKLLLHAYVKDYIQEYESYATNAISDRIEVCKTEIASLVRENEKSLNQIRNLKIEIEQKAPRYFSQDYETLKNKATYLIDSHNKKLNENLIEINALETQIKIFNFQKEKQISSQNFFEGFLEEFKKPVEEYLLEKQQEKNIENKQDNDIIKENRQVKAVVKKAKKSQGKKKRKNKKR